MSVRHEGGPSEASSGSGVASPALDNRPKDGVDLQFVLAIQRATGTIRGSTRAGRVSILSETRLPIGSSTSSRRRQPLWQHSSPLCGRVGIALRRRIGRRAVVTRDFMQSGRTSTARDVCSGQLDWPQLERGRMTCQDDKIERFPQWLFGDGDGRLSQWFIT